MTIICKQSPSVSSIEETKALTQEEEVIVCAFCNHHISDPSKQIIVNNSFRHIFANLHGYVFEIGCFSEAIGCKPNSPSSTEFSWFPGFAWKVGTCHYCSKHLGWVFSSDSKTFYGLILEKLIFP